MTKNNGKTPDPERRGGRERVMDRRTFLKVSGVLGAAVGMGGLMRPTKARAQGAPAPTYSTPGPDPVEGTEGIRLIRTTCLMCHGNCGLQVKVADGRILKVDGNPFHPNCLDPHLPYESDPNTFERGRCCAKAQAALEQVYTPIRLKHPLKRVGPRGSGQWQVITWEQAFTEIIEGGELFPGEGNVEGLRAVRDLVTPIDPNAPDLGPKANQFCFIVGRWQHGRKELTDRFARDAYGTINFRHDHTSICELSHHIAHSLVFLGHPPATPGASPKVADKNHFKPDMLNARCVVMFGTSPLEAAFPMVPFARKTMQFKANGGKLIVVDPRFSATAAKADTWVPIKPGTDGALALGMIRWILDNNQYDALFLRNTTMTAAQKVGESTWTNATYLVRTDNGKLLRASDLGIGAAADFVVWSGGQAYAVVWNDDPALVTCAVSQADLEVTQTFNIGGQDVVCKSAFTLLKERAQERTVAEYARICGLDEALVAQVARDLAQAGKQGVATMYRGVVQHTNGIYNALGVIALNLLMGNINWKGGYAGGGGHYEQMGGKAGIGPGGKQPYDLKQHPGKVTATGTPITREKKKYEDSTEFQNGYYYREGQPANKAAGYPAYRPWFPLTSNVWQEVWASIAAGYPYPIKILWLNMGNPTYSCPAGTQYTEVLKDRSKVPLFICCDRVMSEAAALADYILPDVSFLERFEADNVAPTIVTKTSGTRVPVLQEDDGRLLPKPQPLYPDTRLAEDIVIEVAKRLGLPGFGPGGLGPYGDLNEARDWYEKIYANFAAEETGVPGATEKERMDYLLARGGRFENADQAYDGRQMKHKYKGMCALYVEKLATTKDSITGQPYEGLPKYEPIRDAKGNDIADADYPFQLITYKNVWHTQSRTAENDLLMALQPENYVEINAADAEGLGIRTGDRVKITSATNGDGVIGTAKTTEGIRPGVIAVSMSFGHWEYGARAWQGTGAEFPAEPQPFRSAGLTANPVMRLDESIGFVGLEDKIGGSAAFYDTRVKVEKV